MPISQETPTILIGPSEVLVGAAISVAGMLRDNESLSGTPSLTVTPSNSPDATPTATSPAVSASSLTINGEAVAAGEAIQFTLTGNSARKTMYTITWLCSTSGGSTLQGAVTFKIV